MVREIVVDDRCDVCGAKATRIGVHITIGQKRAGAAGGASRRPPRTIDLCEPHYRSLVQPLVDALVTFGHGKRGPKQERQRGWKRTTGPYKCQLCIAAPHKSATTLANHLSKLHGLTLEEYVEKHGELVPLTPAEALEPVEVTCPEGCGQTYSTATGTRWPQQAMVAHMRGRHQLSWRPGQ